MLNYPRLSVRKFALRALAELGAAESLQRLATPGAATAWALARCAGIGDAAGGSEAIPALIKELLRSPPELSGEAARRLASLGPAIVPACLKQGRRSGTEARRRLCQVLWYLGPQARGTEDMLAGWLPDPEAEATLLAMESAGSGAMLQALVRTARRTRRDAEQKAVRRMIQFRENLRRCSNPTRIRPSEWPSQIYALPVGGVCPLWLDAGAVSELSRLAFDLDEDLRIQAVRALGGFGPCRRQALPLLGYLAHHDSEAVRRAARESLMASRCAWAIAELMEVDPAETELPVRWDASYKAAGRGCPEGQLDGNCEDEVLAALFRIQPQHLHSQQFSAFHQLRQSGSAAVRLAATRVLLWSSDTACLQELLSHPSTPVRARAVQRTNDPELLHAALNDSEARVRLAAAVRLCRWSSPRWETLLLHPDAGVRNLAADSNPPRDSVIAALELGPPNPEMWRAASVCLPNFEFEKMVTDHMVRARAWEKSWMARHLKEPQNLLGSPDLHTRRAAAAALLRSPIVPEPAWLEHAHDWSVRVLLIAALTRAIRESDEIEWLRALCRHPEAAVSGPALIQMAHQGGSEEVAQVEAGRFRPEAEVRRASLQFLIRFPLSKETQEAWKDPDSQVRKLTCDELARREVLPEDLEESLRIGRFVSYEAADLLLRLEGPEYFSEVAADSLDHLKDTEKALMARRLGWLNRFEPLAERFFQNRCAATARLMAAALTEGSLALDWLARHFELLRVSEYPSLVAAVGRVLEEANELELLLQMKFLERSWVVEQFPEQVKLAWKNLDPRRDGRQPGELLGSYNPHIRWQAASHFVCTGDLDLLWDGLRDPDSRVRWRFTRAALAVGFPAGVEWAVLEQADFDPRWSPDPGETELLRLLDSSQALIRMRAAFLLGERAAEDLRRVAETDPCRAVRQSARRALQGWRATRPPSPVPFREDSSEKRAFL